MCKGIHLELHESDSFCRLLLHQCIRQEYVGYSEDKQSFMLVFDEDAIVLKIPNSSPLVVDGWRILTLTSHPEVCGLLSY